MTGEPQPMERVSRPRALFVYFTYSQQNPKVVEAMGEVLRERGWDVREAAIEFTDKRYAERFSRFPLRHVYRDLLGMLPAQTRRATGEIRIPDEAREGDYDLVIFGSPTWFFTTNMPLRSYLESADAGRILAGKRFAIYVTCRRYWSVNLKEARKLGIKQGGTYVDGIHLTYAGGQIRSLLSLISYLGSGEYRERYLGVKIPKTNLQAAQLESARGFATELADRVGIIGNLK